MTTTLDRVCAGLNAHGTEHASIGASRHGPGTVRLTREKG
jgi:hypothetical protein